MLEGKAELSPNENHQSLVYFDTHNNDSDEEDSEDTNVKKSKENEITQMEQYLKKKRLQSSKIGKLKFVRYYMEKPEIKKRRRRERKKKVKEIQKQQESEPSKNQSTPESQSIPSLTNPQTTPPVEIPIPPISLSTPQPIQNPQKEDLTPLHQSTTVPAPAPHTENLSKMPVISPINPFLPKPIIEINRSISDPVSVAMSSPSVANTPNFPFSTTPFATFSHQDLNRNQGNFENNNWEFLENRGNYTGFPMQSQQMDSNNYFQVNR